MADVIFGLAGGRARQQMEDRAPLPLVPGESVLGEVYVSTRDVRIPGFQWTGSGLEGMLVLTNWRAAGSAPDGVTRGSILAQRRQFFEADLAADTRNALARLGLTLPVALCTGIAPIFGFLALREERRLRARAELEKAAVPARVVWITRLGWAWIVIGGLLWALILYAIVFGPIVKE